MKEHASPEHLTKQTIKQMLTQENKEEESACTRRT